MLTRTILLRLAVMGCAAVCSASVMAQEEPVAQGPPVAAGVYQPKAQIYDTIGYHSPTLGAVFHTEWMYILQNGQQITFWGARITKLNVDSPLHALGVRAGDVITRLDGIRISTGMYSDNDVWQLPECERHFGRTEVRYIITGINAVKIGDIMLSGGGPVPVAP
jgi:hypothetical protein